MPTAITLLPTSMLFVVALVTAGSIAASVGAAARSAGESVRSSGRLMWAAAAALSVWLAFTSWVANTGVLQVFDARPSRLAMLPLTATFASLLLASRQRARTLLRMVPRGFPVLVQTMRVGVEVVLFLLFADGLVPARMTFERGNLDILVGLSAPLVALGIRRRVAPRGLVIAWNVVGIGLLANIVQTVVRSLPGPLQTLTDGPAPVVITTAPFVWVPAFFVPVALLGHLLSLQQWTAPSLTASVARPTAHPTGPKPSPSSTPSTIPMGPAPTSESR